jgi:hypothetical protein
MSAKTFCNSYFLAVAEVQPAPLLGLFMILRLFLLNLNYLYKKIVLSIPKNKTIC